MSWLALVVVVLIEVGGAEHPQVGALVHMDDEILSTDPNRVDQLLVHHLYQVLDAVLRHALVHTKRGVDDHRGEMNVDSPDRLVVLQDGVTL